jgi:hypothetical protein
MFTGQRRGDVHRGRMLGALLRRDFPVLQDFATETRSAARQHHPRPLIFALEFVCLTSDSGYMVCSARDDVRLPLFGSYQIGIWVRRRVRF